MSNAVLQRREALHRSGTRPARAGRDRSRPATGRVQYGHARWVSDAPHGEIADIGWRTFFAGAAATALVVLGLVGIAGVVANPAVPVAPGGPGTPAGTVSVEVAAGESLAEVAARAVPGVPVDRAVRQIRDLNALPVGAPAPGAELLVPAPNR
ncbi:hypothetical protein G4H71_19810 [Rhodococcus triatomae]|uniref:LysM domain-containing protein n=1 Tax=Rhodococcus triatomae TaxID=300028 RepID=A0A1G8MUP6_9NOCA|nr:hypothetical protein [Rhodococcus triatomae]QNG19097.1 hypothetical protein G4H72_10570 [Rhodococcus triatomae]QNG24990.1 hypothetical protein G4H71_19810 [Rhodococcus triatomae]SDI71593.1 hypothetical protein SAMN05444695_11079 [Rhodococcus triatomae]